VNKNAFHLYPSNLYSVCINALQIHAIVSFLLEPEIEQPNGNTLTKDPVKKTVKVCCVVHDTGIGELELQLPWEIVRYDQVLQDPLKQIEALEEKVVAEVSYKTELQEIEPLKKYNTAHMYGMSNVFVCIQSTRKLFSYYRTIRLIFSKF